MKALIVEQDQAARSIFEVVLTRRGYEVVTCQRLDASWRELHTGDYGLVVLDVPEDHGNQINELQRILNRTAEDDILVLLVASPDAEISESYELESAMTFQICRPNSTPELFEQITLIERKIANLHSNNSQENNSQPLSKQSVPASILPIVRHLVDLILVLNNDLTIRVVTASDDYREDSFADNLAGHPIRQFVHPDDDPTFTEGLRQVTQPDRSVTLMLRFSLPDGDWMNTEFRMVNLIEDCNVQGLLVTVQEVSHPRMIEAGEDTRSRLSENAWNSLSPQIAVDTDFVIVGWTDRAEDEFGWTERESVGRSLLNWEAISVEDRTTTLETFERIRNAAGEIQCFSLAINTKDGRRREFDWYGVFVADSDGLDGSFVCQGYASSPDPPRDDTSSHGARIGSYLIQHSTEMLAIVDSDCRIVYQSPAVERGLGYNPTTFHQARLLDFVHPEDRERVASEFQTALSHPGEQVHVEMRLRHEDSSWRYIETIFTNHVDDNLQSGVFVNALDITKRKMLEQRLTRQAFFDSLTQLPNRVLFMHRLDRALDVAASAEHPIAVLFLDLDRFKVVNDSLGHEIGDRLLVAIAERLRATVRPGDTVARLSGDEFIILLRGVASDEEIVQVAQRIIREVGAPVQLNGYEVTVSTSIGITTANSGDLTAQDLLRNVDIALYRAKDLGADNYVVFDASMARQAVTRLELENDLRQAIQRHEFRIQYLPEISLQHSELVGLEVLVRWRHPERGYVMPDEFMGVAEETGLIVPIGRWVINQACQQMQHWLETFTEAAGIVISVNLSAREFQQPDLVPHILSTLDQYGLNPEQLRIEIAETVTASNPEIALEKLHSLSEHNVGLAIDNFGSGYSSLSYLTQVSFGTLKIDQQFVSGPGGVTNNLAIVRAITSLAHALGMKVTAEGVEDGKQLTRVRAAGCDFGQGFLFSEPLDSDAVETLFLDRQPEP